MCSIFVCLCFLFIINGSNLIDGYNGLLSIHTLIILINLFFVNYFNENNDLAFFILYTILIIAVFLKYNFPKATIYELTDFFKDEFFDTKKVVHLPIKYKP